MKKLKKTIVVVFVISGLFFAYHFLNTNSCMQKAPHYNSFLFSYKPIGQFEIAQNNASESSEKKNYKRFKHTEDAMKEFGRYVPLPKDEPYFTECTFGEVTYRDGEPVQFTHFVNHRDLKINVRKGAEWRYNEQLTYGMYYYRVSKEPFTYSLEDSELEDVKTILLDDGVEALFSVNLMEWKDDRFYYQLFHRNSYREPTTLTFLANSSRVNISYVPEWVNEID
ncbi:hypothetical protein MHZ92_05105 [Sporosarcina sp. ACRSL]|uniref:hypothetical protein n=1 Tax=Sporosarcina sp. ACRSL TaxID=2918215 RepID=UPI001EF5C40A|nr:hypothetical protein [Sporosarcina sp. ACRSL]MCG7343499.1 hypothetical protein [Sporosarcina sp. ACRSL]